VNDVIVRVRLFAMQRQQTGTREHQLVLERGATVADAWQALVAAFPILAPSGGSVRFARNAVYTDPASVLADGDELAIIPPVAGGAGGGPGNEEPYRRIELHASPFDETLLATLRREVPTPADGALVLFVGQTRDSPGTPAPGQEEDARRFAGRVVQGLEYEAFEPMVEAVLAAIADEIAARFDVRRIAILHRTGSVPLGDASVVIACAAAHRDAAFEACRYAIEELKARAPIWKSERFADGSIWIGRAARTAPEPDTGRA
jgi:molybdopterin synthase catalytic subunit